MKLLHTSDWHLGQTWNGRSRHREFEAFLDWMIETLRSEQVDVLVVAGDIFDTSTPNPVAQEMYFNFLRRVSDVCRMTVIVSGNHDSPALLDAPKALLRGMNVRVVGTAGQPKDEIVVVSAKDDPEEPELIIAAVPFLRDRDIRLDTAGETIDQVKNKTVEGIRFHYRRVCDEAEAIRRGSSHPDRIPLVATGHLAVDGCKPSDKVRDIHLGTLHLLGSDLFPEEIDYLALGHIHKPQVLSANNRRYSGSPIPMSFDEAEYDKLVYLVQFDGRTPTVRSLKVPAFSTIVQISGDLKEIKASLLDLALDLSNQPKDRNVFVGVDYTGTEVIPELSQAVRDALPKLEGAFRLDITRIRNEQALRESTIRMEPRETLEELKPIDIFKQLLEQLKEEGAVFADPSEEQLIRAHQEVETELAENE